MRLPKDFSKNIQVEPTVVVGSYTEGASDPTPAEVDIGTAKKVMLYVDVQTLNTAELTITLKEAQESGGSFTTVTDEDDNDIKLAIDETGQFTIDAEHTKPILKVEVSQDADTADEFTAIICAGEFEDYPIG